MVNLLPPLRPVSSAREAMLVSRCGPALVRHPKLSKAAQEKSVQRLATAPAPRAEARDLRRRPKGLHKEAMTAHIDRLYTQALDRKMEAWRGFVEAPPLHKPRPYKDKGKMNASVHRVYDQALQQRRNLTQALVLKHNKAPPTRKLESPEDMEDANDRLYTKPLERRRGKDAQLGTTYLAPLSPVSQRSDAEWNTTLERLCIK